MAWTAPARAAEAMRTSWTAIHCAIGSSAFAASIAAAARHYRESLEALLPFQEAAVERAEACEEREHRLRLELIDAGVDIAIEPPT